LVGLNYPPDRRVEVGDVVDDIPAKSIKWLVECGAIEQVNAKPSKGAKAEPIVANAADDATDEKDDA
jgi:hypothetical protein